MRRVVLTVKFEILYLKFEYMVLPTNIVREYNISNCRMGISQVYLTKYFVFILIY